MSVKEEISVVTITKKEYEQLLDSQRFLDALESAGVDNWEWYDHARDIYNGQEE